MAKSRARHLTARPATRLQVLEHQVRHLARRSVGKPTDEKGATGTPIVGGYISGEDYNPKLDGVNGIKQYDEMRRSSAQVQASLQVIKLPILSARPAVVPAKNGDAQDRAIADACGRALFGKEKIWKDALRHLLLRLEFGVSALEKVWVLDKAFTVGDRVQPIIRPHRLAPRLPQTYDRFDIEDGQLKTLHQVAIKDGQMRPLAIPGQDLIVTVHQQEGDNYWGRSLLRHAYMHWFYAQQAYRIGAVRLDRYGVGIPVAELEEKHKATPKELDKIEKLLKAMRVHERAYFMLPFGVKVRIMVPENGKGGVDEIPAIKHHEAQIARNVIANFILEQGTEGLGSERTKALKDFFSSALESVAGDIIGDLQDQLLVPFCDMNFPMDGREYPRLELQDLTDVDTGELAEFLNALSGGDFITPDDGIEEVLRKVMKLPPMTEEQKGRARTPRSAQPPAPGAGDDDRDDKSASRGTAPGKKKTAPADDDDEDTAAKAKKKARELRLASNYTDPVTARVYGREPTALELAVFALREVPDRLDIETRDLVAALADIRTEQLAKVAAQIAKKDARKSTGPFTDIRPADITISGRSDLERAIRQTQTRLAAYGALHVRGELQRQGASMPTALRSRDAYWTDERIAEHAQAIRLAADEFDALDESAAASARAAASALVSSAKVSADKQLSLWKARILETALRLRRTGLRGDALTAAIIETLTPEVTTGVQREARGHVNGSFALGRATEAAANGDLIDYVVYSALMDVHTCDPCASLDGKRIEFGSEDYYRTMPPYAGCDGNKGHPDACRCVHLFIYKPQ